MGHIGGGKYAHRILGRNPEERPHRSFRSKFGGGGCGGILNKTLKMGCFWIGFIRIR